MLCPFIIYTALHINIGKISCRRKILISLLQFTYEIFEIPIFFNFRSTMANDLIYYENVTRENGPAMTWSMHTVGHLRLGNNEQATRLFDRSYKPYVRDPYKVIINKLNT